VWRNHDDIARDQRPIDRGIPIGKNKYQHDLGGVRGEIFVAHHGSAPSSHLSAIWSWPAIIAGFVLAAMIGVERVHIDRKEQ
jgi:hypothetical protein